MQAAGASGYFLRKSSLNFSAEHSTFVSRSGSIGREDEDAEPQPTTSAAIAVPAIAYAMFFTELSSFCYCGIPGRFHHCGGSTAQDSSVEPGCSDAARRSSETQNEIVSPFLRSVNFTFLPSMLTPASA